MCIGLCDLADILRKYVKLLKYAEKFLYIYRRKLLMGTIDSLRPGKLKYILYFMSHKDLTPRNSKLIFKKKISVN